MPASPATSVAHRAEPLHRPAATPIDITAIETVRGMNARPVSIAS